MADIAPFTAVDIAPCQFEWGVGPHALHFLDRALQVKERHDLDDTANGDYHQHRDGEDERVSLEKFVFLPHSALLRRHAGDLGRWRYEGLAFANVAAHRAPE